MTHAPRDCQRARDLLLANVNRKPGASTSRVVDAHLKRCARCRAWERHVRLGYGLLRAVPDVRLSPARLDQIITAAIEAHFASDRLTGVRRAPNGRSLGSILEHKLQAAVGPDIDLARVVRDGAAREFRTDDRGIIGLKLDFALSARKFVCNRKGEDVGAGALAGMLALMHARQGSVPDRFLRRRAWVAAIDEFRAIWLRSVRRPEHPPERPHWAPVPSLRVLCRDLAENRRSREVYRTLGYEIRNYPRDDQAKDLRFYLTEGRFALFVRQSDRACHGILGSCPAVQSRLLARFEAEWEQSDR